MGSRVVVQLPALNEAASLGAVLAAMPAALPGIDEIRTVVVDDGSTDDTGRIAAAGGAAVVRHPRPLGVGAAFRSGLRRAMELGADIVVTIDADGQFNPEDIGAIVAPIVAGEADFVTASRFKDPGFEPRMPKAKRWGNAVIARWVSRMTGQGFSDVSCGFRAYNREAFLRLNLTGDFTYTHEVFLALAFAGLRIREVPVHVRGSREHGTSRVAGNLLRYAWGAGGIILGTYRDYRPLRFFSLLALAFLGAGSAALGFLAVHWLRTGAFTPYKSAGFVGGAFWGAALLVYVFGLLAQMQVRVRGGLEEALYRIRRLELERLQR